MIERKTQIEVLYDIKHKHDSDTYSGYDYENNLFYNMFSNVMFGNKKMQDFLPLLERNAVWMIESVLPIRNWWNYTINKYYNKHNN